MQRGSCEQDFAKLPQVKTGTFRTIEQSSQVIDFKGFVLFRALVQ
jgi:hypothetical protein